MIPPGFAVTHEVKRRLLVSIAISTAAELVVLFALLRRGAFAEWKAVIGTLAIMVGLLVLYNIALLPAKGKERILRHSMVANPGIAMIFAGVILLTVDRDKLFAVALLAGAGAIGAFLVGIILLVRYLAAWSGEQVG